MSNIQINDIQTKLPTKNFVKDLERILIDIRTNFKTLAGYIPVWDNNTDEWNTAYTHSQETGNAHEADADDFNYIPGETIKEILEETINTGMLHDITITDDGGLDISWTTSEIYNSSTELVVDTSAGSGTCTDNLINYLTWTTGITLTLSTTKPDPSNNDVGIAEISCQSGDIWHIQKSDRLKHRTYEISEALSELFPALVVDGLLTEEDPDATNVWDVLLGTGTYYTNSHERTTIASIIYSRTTNMVRWYKVSGVWTSDTNAEIDITKWNDGTDLAAVNGAKYYRSNFFITETAIHWIYPDVEYNTIAQALGGGCPTMPPGLHHFPKSTCLILKGNAVTFPAAGSVQWIDVRPMIGGTSSSGTVSDHGLLAGLADDDHTQYALLTGRSGDTLLIDRLKEFTADNGVDVASVKFLSSTMYLNDESSVVWGTASASLADISFISGDNELAYRTNNNCNHVFYGYDSSSYIESLRIQTDPGDGIEFWRKLQFSTNPGPIINLLLLEKYADFQMSVNAGGVNTVSLKLVGATGIVDIPVSLTTDIINEHTAAAGVTIEGILLKDSAIKFQDNEKAEWGTGTDFEIYHDSTNTIVRNKLSNSDTIFYVNVGGDDTEVFRIDGSSGNVGIGRTSPAHPLDVNGKVLMGPGTANRILIRGNTLEIPDENSNAALNFNYYGYQEGTTQFRDVNVYNGKAGLVFKVDGSNSLTYTNNGTVSSLSDERVKKDILSIESGLDLIINLRPVTYKFNGKGGTIDDGVPQVGFLANEVKQLNSLITNKTKRKFNKDDKKETELDTMSIGLIVPYLVKAIQEQQVQINNLEERIIQLEKLIK